jgi:hypothetical protein
LANIE